MTSFNCLFFWHMYIVVVKIAISSYLSLTPSLPPHTHANNKQTYRLASNTELDRVR